MLASFVIGRLLLEEGQKRDRKLLSCINLLRFMSLVWLFSLVGKGRNAFLHVRTRTLAFHNFPLQSGI